METDQVREMRGKWEMIFRKGEVKVTKALAEAELSEGGQEEYWPVRVKEQPGSNPDG